MELLSQFIEAKTKGNVDEMKIILHNIINAGDIYYKNEEIVVNYFSEIITCEQDEDSTEILDFSYDALLCAFETYNGLKVGKMITPELLLRIPTKHFQDWDESEININKKLLQLLTKACKNYKIVQLFPTISEIAARLCKIIALKDINLELSLLALECLKYICLANKQRLGYLEFKSLNIYTTLKDLIIMEAPDRNDLYPLPKSALLVTPIILILESVGNFPKKTLLEIFKKTTKSLFSSLFNNDKDNETAASDVILSFIDNPTYLQQIQESGDFYSGLLQIFTLMENKGLNLYDLQLSTILLLNKSVSIYPDICENINALLLKTSDKWLRKILDKQNIDDLLFEKMTKLMEMIIKIYNLDEKTSSNNDNLLFDKLTELLLSQPEKNADDLNKPIVKLYMPGLLKALRFICIKSNYDPILLTPDGIIGTICKYSTTEIDVEAILFIDLLENKFESWKDTKETIKQVSPDITKRLLKALQSNNNIKLIVNASLALKAIVDMEDNNIFDKEITKDFQLNKPFHNVLPTNEVSKQLSSTVNMLTARLSKSEHKDYTARAVELLKISNEVKDLDIFELQEQLKQMSHQITKSLERMQNLQAENRVKENNWSIILIENENKISSLFTEITNMKKDLEERLSFENALREENKRAQARYLEADENVKRLEKDVLFFRGLSAQFSETTKLFNEKIKFEDELKEKLKAFEKKFEALEHSYKKVKGENSKLKEELEKYYSKYSIKST